MTHNLFTGRLGDSSNVRRDFQRN